MNGTHCPHGRHLFCSAAYDDEDEEDDMEINALQLKRGFENRVEIEADKVRIYQAISN